MSQAEADALLKAHEYASERGYGTYTSSDLAAKARILRDAGYSMGEVDRLMRSGLAGKPPSTPKGSLIKISHNSTQFKKDVALSNAQRELRELTAIIETRGKVTANTAIYNGVTFYREKDAGGKLN